MQKAPVYLYSNTVEVLLDVDHTNRINNVMYQRTITLQRGLQNTLQLQFKNSDQKLLNISSSTFYFSMYDAVDGRVILDKPVAVLDDGVTRSLRGLANVVFRETDTLGLQSTQYKFVIKHMDPLSGSLEPAYADSYYGMAGTINLIHSAMPPLIDSVSVTSFQQYYNADFGLQQYEWYSGNLDAHPEFQSGTALHTVATYMTAFRGEVRIEATLENTPSTFANYAVVSSKTYTGYTGVDYTNFNGIFSKVRVHYIPAKNPATNQNNDTAYSGTVDRVLYRC